MLRLRFAARDPGGANVLAAFLTSWTRESGLNYDIWSLPRATSVFLKAGLRPREFREGRPEAELEQAWRGRPAAGLITGTSHYAPFEATLWDMARRHGCPSLAVLDQWMNLHSRFARGRPDYVGAIDTEQAAELAKLGFTEEQIVVTGHPWLSTLLQQRRELGVAPGEKGEDRAVRLLFVSESIAQDVAQGYAAPFGFDEFDSFTVAYRAAARAVRTGLAVSLAVKHHPYEEPERFQQRVRSLGSAPGLTVRYLGGLEAPIPWAQWSHLVVGISSVLLIEAMVLGRPVVSIQPGLVRENTFVPSRRGYARTYTDAAEAEEAVLGLLLDPRRREQVLAMQRPFVDALPRDSASLIVHWIRDKVRPR